MHYTYTLDEKDFKEACFNSVHVLDVIQRNRILFSVVYSFILFVLLFLPFTRLLSVFIGYLILSTIIYFWAYPQRLFNIDRKRRRRPKQWTVKEEISLFEDKLVQNSHNIKRTVYWKDIAGGGMKRNRTLFFILIQKN